MFIYFGYLQVTSCMLYWAQQIDVYFFRYNAFNKLTSCLTNEFTLFVLKKTAECSVMISATSYKKERDLQTMATTYYFLPTRNLFGEDSVLEAGTLMKIGRASCRERV